MKNLIALSLFSLIGTATFAQYQETTLRVHNTEGVAVTVYVDGYETGNTAPEVVINNLQPGKHELRIVQPALFPLRHFGPRPLYCGAIDIHPNTVLTACINRYGEVALSELAVYRPEHWEQHPQHGHHHIYGSYDQHYENEHHADYYPQPMSAYDFDQLKLTLNNVWFETTKLEVLKSAVRNNCFNTFQVADLMALFTFESNKLDVAETLYAQTIDKQNYYRLSNNFAFNSSIDDLNHYIASR